MATYFRFYRNRRQASRPKRRNTGRKLKRTVVFVDGDRIKKRIDGVTEIPREFRYRGNRHRYYWSREYENEVKKEEDARRKWEVLAAEAKRQEELAQQLGEGEESRAKFVDVDGPGSVVYRILDEHVGK